MPRFDTVVKNGMIVDGTRSPRYRGDIGIKDGRITEIGELDAGKGANEIDASSLIVAPGFIDEGRPAMGLGHVSAVSREPGAPTQGRSARLCAWSIFSTGTMPDKRRFAWRPRVIRNLERVLPREDVPPDFQLGHVVTPGGTSSIVLPSGSFSASGRETRLDAIIRVS